MPPKLTIKDARPEEIPDLHEVRAGRMSIGEYRTRHGRGFNTVKAFLAGISAADERTTDATFDEVLNRVDLGSDLWMGMERVHREIGKLRQTDFEVDVHIQDDKPVLICFLSDLHIGHTESDMRKIREDCERIKATDGMYVIFGGDMTDNVNTLVAGRGTFHEQLTPVDVQKELVERLAEFLGPEKILAMLLGNHDEWSLKTDGFDPVRYLAKHVGCPYLGPFGYVNVHHGTQAYRILAAHQFRMNSSFNKTHAAKRAMDFIGDADVVFTGHKHDPAAEQVYVRRGKRFYAQSGTYLKKSVYGSRLGFTESNTEMPGVLLWPERFSFVGVFNALDEGVWMLEAARGG